MSPQTATHDLAIPAHRCKNQYCEGVDVLEGPTTGDFARQTPIPRPCPPPPNIDKTRIKSSCPRSQRSRTVLTHKRSHADPMRRERLSRPCPVQLTSGTEVAKSRYPPAQATAISEAAKCERRKVWRRRHWQHHTGRCTSRPYVP